MKQNSFALAWLVCTSLIWQGTLRAEQTASPEQIAFFEARIRPLLVNHCIACHGVTKQKGGLRLDSRPAWAKGGDSGPALVPGKPEESLIIKAVRHTDDDLRMPPDKRLPASDLALLVEWVRQGAPDPRDRTEITKEPKDAWAATFQKRLDWWSLKPLVPIQPPGADGKTGLLQPIDRFIRTSLNAAHLEASPQADPEQLLRRLAFVVTGLPPSPALRTAYLADVRRNPDAAYEKLVDQLLASPHFGEHFARHWMDVVRYTDTYGYEWDNPAKGSYEYRDYLIRALNEDVGFDQLVREQLAGDLLKDPRVNTERGLIESLIGPMFFHMGEHRHGSSLDFNGVHQEMVHNKIDAFSKAFLATTVACARCHDHKLEAVSQRDYYALGAVFMTPRWTTRPIDLPGRQAGAINRLKELRESIRKELAGQWRKAQLTPEDWRKVLTKAPTIDQIDYPLARLANSEPNTAANWMIMADEWRKVRSERIQANKIFNIVTDFKTPNLPADWVTDGEGMTHGFVTEGTPLVALEGTEVISRLLPHGLHTHALSSKLPGALRPPPQHKIPGAFNSIRTAGGSFAGSLMITENAFQGEGVTFYNATQPTWKSFGDTPLKNGVTKVAVEFATASLNPNFPPRTGLAAGLPNNDFGYDKRSWLSITGIVTHETPGTPQDTLDAFAMLYDGQTPQSPAEAQQRLNEWLAGSVKRWCDDQTVDGDLPILEWLLGHKLLVNKVEPGSNLERLVTEYRRCESALAFPRAVNSMDERFVTKSGLYFNIRGNVDALGELVMPDFLQMFAGRHQVVASPGSGRLELAESLVRPDHPLTSRVYVNRVWQWVFGQGIVGTPDDFGRLGTKPSHPEMLDWLARDFMTHRWSTKYLVRQLLISATFRQASGVSASASHIDPENKLLHHYPTRRLEAESIRDNLLAASGRLDPTMFGRPIMPPRGAEDSAKRLYSGPLDGLGRRSIYTQTSIMEPAKFLVGFNLPDPRLPTGKRDSTNDPTQALIMLNDPFVAAMARHWGQQLVKNPSKTIDDQMETMFITAFSRAPTAMERKDWAGALHDFATPNHTDLLRDEEAWTRLAHALFNTQEFIYYR
jgi:mono/diheme cytochrome c family protein